MSEMDPCNSSGGFSGVEGRVLTAATSVAVLSAALALGSDTGVVEFASGLSLLLAGAGLGSLLTVGYLHYCISDNPMTATGGGE